MKEKEKRIDVFIKMATSINQFNDDKDLLLHRIKDLEFVDDVSEFKCKRCEKVLIQHYIANCGHAFCQNCKKLLGDGSGRWPCPHCHEFVKKIDFQDFEFEQKMFDQRVRCANTKYGCSFVCLLKELAEHLKSCNFTRENALPVPYKETNTIEAVLEQLSSINRSMETMEKKITKIEVNQQLFDNKLKTLETVNGDLPEQISKINIEIEDSKKNELSDKWISTLDKMKSKIANLNKKSDLWLEVLELKEEKINKLIHQQKMEIESDLKNVSCTLQDEMKINSEKMNEANDKFVKQLKSLDNKIEVNQNELKVVKLKTDSCLEKNEELNRVTQMLQEKNIHVKNNLSDKDNRIKNIYKKAEMLEVLVNNKLDKLNADLQENTTKLENLIQAKCSISNEKTDVLSRDLNEKIGKVKIQLQQELGNKIQVKTTELHDLVHARYSILHEKSVLLSKDLKLGNEKIDKIIFQLKKGFNNNIKKVNSSLAASITRLKNAYENEVKHLKNVEIKVEKNQHELIALKQSAGVCLKPQNESVNAANQLRTVIESNKNQSAQLKSLEKKVTYVKSDLFYCLQSKTSIINQQIQPIMLKDVYWKRPADFVWQIPRASEILDENFIHKEMQSALFQLNDYPVTLQAKLSFTADSLRVRLSSERAMQSQPQPSIYLIIRNQFYESRAWDVMKLASKELFQSLPQNHGDYVFEKIAKSQLRGLFNSYVNNYDQLLLEFHVEPPWMANHACSFDGTLSWAIDNYRKGKELETSGYVAFHESPYFYSKLNGYRVRIRFWLNFGHQGDVYAGVDFLTGEYDDFLPDDIIPHKITITILNPKNPNGHIIKSEIYDPQRKRKKARGFYICGKDEIESFVTGDIFYYHAKIEEI